MPDIDHVLEKSYTLSFSQCYEPEILKTALPKMIVSQASLIQSSRYYVALSSPTQIIACGGWSREQPGSGAIIPKTGHIRQFATHPDFFNKGAARKIFEKCVEQARSDGIGRFECYSSLCAVSFYKSVGMRVQDKVSIKMGEKTLLPVVLMEMDI